MQYFRRIHEINAIRAIAIIGVILNHVIGLKGGFIGVDVFFVISGYVITLSILRDKEAKTFTYSNFMYLRIRRILPPLFITSVLTFFIGKYLFLYSLDFDFLSSSYNYQTLFIQNHFFANYKVEYFHSLAEAKLNLHLWSIAIEEQFYIFLPLFFLIFNYKNKLLFFILFLLTLCSFFFTTPYFLSFFPNPLLNSFTSPPSRYYLLHTRAWELLLGVLACLFTFKFSIFLQRSIEKSNLINRVFLILNLLNILLCMCFIKPTMEWPNYNALLPTISTALILMQLHFSNDLFISKFFNNKIFSYIGKSSYSLYLYHWPIYGIALYTNYDFGTQLYDFIFYTIILFLVSHFSYHFIEKKKFTLNKKKSYLFLIFFISIHFFISNLPYLDPKDRSESLGIISKTGMRSSWKAGCNKKCFNKIKKPFIVLWGDSHAGVFYKSLKEYSNSMNLELIYLEGLSLSDHKALRKEVLQSPLLKAVILISRWNWYIEAPINDPQEKNHRYFQYNDFYPTNKEEAVSVFEKSYNDLLKKLENVQIIVLQQVPRYPYLVLKEAFMSELGLRLRPLKKKPVDEYKNNVSQVNKILLEPTLKNKSIKVIDPTEILCPEKVCINRERNNVLYEDDDHLSVYGTKKIMPLIEDALKNKFKY